MRQFLSHFRWKAVFFVAVAFVLGGGDIVCAADKTAEDTPAPTVEKSLSAEEVDSFFVRAVGGKPTAKDFTLEKLDGGELTLSSLRGRVVLLSFWATWCVPCKEEFPALASLSEEFNDRGLTVVAIAADTKKRVGPFVEEYGSGEMVVLLDRYGSVMRKYGVSFFPMGVIVGADGRLIGTMTGARDYSGEAAYAYFEDLLAKELSASR